MSNKLANLAEEYPSSESELSSVSEADENELPGRSSGAPEIEGVVPEAQDDANYGVKSGPTSTSSKQDNAANVVTKTLINTRTNKKGKVNNTDNSTSKTQDDGKQVNSVAHNNMSRMN